MTVGVGESLDKYELLEKVGQGGMAVVYRGMDKSLRREVAIKILHRHLAEHKEARDRFEREAQAVAKLRHENILEIFDFSGNDSDESYIVTEFIDGDTLRDFVAGHQIRFPEVGAMIAVQVCRALVHAHGVGVLHRDVKPENIMIRSDGVVKLTDFGIAQMLDLQRMTVTGQLLGSPAYMSPEHVEGGRLDFRTDVFAVGIVLYQLVTGELPFRGKNPHEILKRIAECRYRDPQIANPLVGKELADIIRCSLERDPDDRFADVSLMLGALEEFLQGSGLGDFRGELARFFDSPVSYEMALAQRLVDHLGKRGRDLLASDRNAALELFNRVLTIDPENQDVLGLIDEVGRRQRIVRIGALALALVVIAGGAIGIARFDRDRDIEPALAVASAAEVVDAAVLPADAAPIVALADAGLVPGKDARAIEKGPEDGVEPGGEAHAATVVDGVDRDVPERDPETDPETPTADAAPASRTLALNLTPRGSQYRVNGGAWTELGDTRADLEVPVGELVLEARNDTCCQEERRRIAADDDRPVRINLPFLPGSITPRCDRPGTRVKVDGRPATLDRAATIIIERLTGTESIVVEFIYDDSVDEQTISIGARQQREVRCAL